jgi:hypothetical protein
MTAQFDDRPGGDGTGTDATTTGNGRGVRSDWLALISTHE